MVYPFFFLLFLFFYFVSFHLDAVMVVKMSHVLFGLLQSKLMIFSAVILSVPELGSHMGRSRPLQLVSLL